MALLEARGRRRCALEVAAAALRAAVGTHTLAKPGQIAPLTAAIGLPAMCNTNNEDHQFIVEQFVDHPVVADAYAAKTPQISLQRVARMRLLGEAINGVHNALTVLSSNLRQVSGRAALNPN